MKIIALNRTKLELTLSIVRPLTVTRPERMLDWIRARLTPRIREEIHESILVFPEPTSTLSSNRTPAYLALTGCGLGSGAESSAIADEQKILDMLGLGFRRRSRNLSEEEKGEAVEAAVTESILD